MDISVVIPVFNEELNVKHLHRELHSVLEGMKLKGGYEIIFIDDGSIDKTSEFLEEIASGDKKTKVIKFRRNSGKTAALSAGFDIAKGKVIITMDGDLQNDPSDIPLLLKKMDEGYDVVSGWRKKRKDPFLSKKVPSKLSNRMASKLTGIKIHDFNCPIKAYKRETLKDIKLYGEMHRYIPAILSWKGYSFSEVVVSHRPRTRGVTKYGVRRIPKGFLDLLLVAFWKRYSLRPIHILGGSGLVLAVAGFILSIYLVVERLFFDMPLADRPIFLLAILMVIIGIQFLVFGVLADILIRVYNAQSDRKVYTVDEVIE